MPLGIGVVSVAPRRIPPTKAVLGVSLGDAEEGALVSMVVPGGGAYHAGIEEGDVIVSIDGTFLDSKEALLRKIATLRAGQRVTIGVTRNENSLTLDAQLMDLSANLFDPTEMEVNGNVSARASGFPRVFQHDTVIAPHQCGGPLVDTHGHVVGVNIARAGRVTSYALPVDVLVPAVREMLLAVNSRPVAEGIKAKR
jgi:S1-C subfamily serine protease